MIVSIIRGPHLTFFEMMLVLGLSVSGFAAVGMATERRPKPAVQAAPAPDSKSDIQLQDWDDKFSSLYHRSNGQWVVNKAIDEERTIPLLNEDGTQIGWIRVKYESL